MSNGYSALLSQNIYERLQNDDTSQPAMGVKVTLHRERKALPLIHAVPGDIALNGKLTYQMDVGTCIYYFKAPSNDPKLH